MLGRSVLSHGSSGKDYQDQPRGNQGRLPGGGDGYVGVYQEQSRGELLQEEGTMCEGLEAGDVVLEARATGNPTEATASPPLPLPLQCSDAKARNSLHLA